MKRDHILLPAVGHDPTGYKPCQGGGIEGDRKTPGDGLLTYDDVNKSDGAHLKERSYFIFPRRLRRKVSEQN